MSQTGPISVVLARGGTCSAATPLCIPHPWYRALEAVGARWSRGNWERGSMSREGPGQRTGPHEGSLHTGPGAAVSPAPACPAGGPGIRSPGCLSRSFSFPPQAHVKHLRPLGLSSPCVCGPISVDSVPLPTSRKPCKERSPSVAPKAEGGNLPAQSHPHRPNALCRRHPSGPAKFYFHVRCVRVSPRGCKTERVAAERVLQGDDAVIRPKM